MSVRRTSFRWCMVIGACALLGVAIFYGFTYIGLSIAVDNAGLTPFYKQTIRALWLGYCLQATLLGLLFTVAAMRPHWISRPLLVICGLLPLAEAVLGFSFTGAYTAMVLLFCAALFVLLGAALWPSPEVAVEVPATPAAAPPPQAAPSPDITSATGPLP